MCTIFAHAINKSVAGFLRTIHSKFYSLQHYIDTVPNYALKVKASVQHFHRQFYKSLWEVKEDDVKAGRRGGWSTMVCHSGLELLQ